MLLPVMIAYAVVLLAIVAYNAWYAAEESSQRVGNLTNLLMWCAAFGASTALMAAMNNANALIRVYSRMVSACYIGFTMLTMIWTDTMAMMAQTSVIVAFFLFLQVYRDAERTGTVFYSCVMLGIATLLKFEYVVVIVPLWACLYATVIASSLRFFVASLVGFVWPWCMMAVAQLAVGDISVWWNAAICTWEGLAASGFFLYESVDGHLLAAAVYIVLLTSFGTVHFFFNSSADKVRTRQIFEFFTAFHVCLLCMMAVRPDMIAVLLPVYIIVAAPLVGHFFALAQSRFMNAFFIISIILGLGLTWIGFLS